MLTKIEQLKSKKYVFWGIYHYLYNELILENATKFNLWRKARCLWIGTEQADNFL